MGRDLLAFQHAEATFSAGVHVPVATWRSLDRPVDNRVAEVGMRNCLHCRGDMLPNSMRITVRDSIDSAIKLADLCSYRCIIGWAEPMARTLETADGAGT